MPEIRHRHNMVDGSSHSHVRRPGRAAPACECAGAVVSAWSRHRVLLFVLLVAVVLGLIGAVAEGVFYLLIIAILLAVADVAFIATRRSRRSHRRDLRQRCGRKGSPGRGVRCGASQGGGPLLVLDVLARARGRDPADLAGHRTSTGRGVLRPRPSISRNGRPPQRGVLPDTGHYTLEESPGPRDGCRTVPRPLRLQDRAAGSAAPPSSRSGVATISGTRTSGSDPIRSGSKK